jgi:hypothetical protein
MIVSTYAGYKWNRLALELSLDTYLEVDSSYSATCPMAVLLANCSCQGDEVNHQLNCY